MEEVRSWTLRAGSLATKGATRPAKGAPEVLLERAAGAREAWMAAMVSELLRERGSVSWIVCVLRSSEGRAGAERRRTRIQASEFWDGH